MSSSASLAADGVAPTDPPRLPAGRTWRAAMLAADAIRTRGATYPALAAHLAEDTRDFLASRVPLAGARVLDLASGHGGHATALSGDGTWVVSADLVPRGGVRRTVADAARLPFAAGSFDGIVCSNLLEHVPSAPPIVREIARVVRPGGWVYLSWSAWYGPLGGHEYSPWHLLGVRPARVIGGLAGVSGRRNVPGIELFPVHVGRTIEGIRSTGLFDVRFAGPRYWPSLSWIVRVPGFREIATWNCLLFMERR